MLWTAFPSRFRPAWSLPCSVATAGKSTAVKILTTLARPDSGSAYVAGLDVLHDQDAVRRAIGLVSQKSSSDPMATGRENLVLAGRIQGPSHVDARARAVELLDRFALTEAAAPSRACRQRPPSSSP